jgi:hypothetical protein
MNIKADKMRYQTNSSAYGLILLGLCFSVAALFAIITPSTVIPDLSTAIEILINIVLMLVTFLAAERCKFYERKWAIIVNVIAAVHVLRIFYAPTKLLAKGQITFFHFTMIVVLLLSSALLLIAGGMITLKKSHVLHSHLKELGE